jgi:hypothetical protein
MVVNATFNNISVTSWQSILLVQENGAPGEKPWSCRKSLTNLIFYTLKFLYTTHGFPMSYIVYFIIFNDLRWDVIVGFVIANIYGKLLTITV